MPPHEPLRCARRATGQLSAHERHELLAFAVSRAPTLAPAYLLERLARYEQVWIARRAGRVEGMLLVQEVATPAATLIYIGPAFSRDGAYAYVFAALLSARLGSADPWLVAMEIENPSVRRMLERLVPSHLFPRADAPAHTASSLRRLALSALACVPHVIDFDPETMTSAIAGAAPARYQVLLVACDGSLATRACVARELAGGLTRLRARSTSVSSERETCDG